MSRGTQATGSFVVAEIQDLAILLTGSRPAHEQVRVRVNFSYWGVG
jgi:hypothetical protein